MAFEEGLAYNVKDLNLEAMQEYANQWNLEWYLLKSGVFKSSIIGFHTQRIQFGFVTYSLPVEIHGNYPKDSILIILVKSAIDSAVYGNMKLNSDEILIVNAADKVDFLSSDAFSIITLCVDKKLFFENFPSDYSKELAEILEQKKFKLQNGGGNYCLFDKIVSIIESLQDEKRTNSIDFKLFEERTLKEIFSFIDFEFSFKEYKKFNITHVRAYLKNNLENEVDIEKIAQRFQISKRQLFSAFKEFYSLTPKKYIHIMRLHKIHNRLQSSHEEQINVSDIAFRYGFRHMSYFTREYKELFNELPSQTLKKK